MFLFIASLISISLGALFQNTSTSFVFMTKPNITFVMLVVFAFAYKDWTKRSILILTSAFFLKFSPFITWIDIVFVAVAFFIIALADYLPWKHIINSIVAVAVGAIIMSTPAFSINSLVIEISANTVLIILFFPMVKLLYEKEKKKQANRF